MDTTMMHMTRQTPLLFEGIVGAAAVGCGGFSMLSNSAQRLMASGVAGIRRRGIAGLWGGIQGIGVYTNAPLFAVVDGIGVPRRRKRRV